MDNDVVVVVRRGDVVRRLLNELVGEVESAASDSPRAESRLTDLRVLSQSKAVAAVLLPLDETEQAHEFPGEERAAEKSLELVRAYGLKPIETSPAAVNGAVRSTLEERVDLAERTIIEDCLRRNQRRRKETAAELGISRVTLYNKMKKLGLQ